MGELRNEPNLGYHYITMAYTNLGVTIHETAQLLSSRRIKQAMPARANWIGWAASSPAIRLLGWSVKSAKGSGAMG